MAQAASTEAWGATLAAALIGTERAPVRAPDTIALALPNTGDPGSDLLARLGALGAYQLAGTALAADALVPFSPLDAAGPACPPAAATRLAAFLASGGASERIAEWYALAAERGVRAPPEILAALDHRAGTATEAALIERIAGPELSWLNRVWTGDDEPAAAADDWTEGDAKARVAAFTAFRQRDPSGARAALEAAFRSEKADMRTSLVAALRSSLSAADEPFLETCLDDRATGVREAAQSLLPLLPASRFAQRMTVRVQAALQMKETRRLLRSALRELDVILPEEAPDLARDGVAPAPYRHTHGGPRAQLLREIVSNAPLSAYAAHPPRLWLELALRSEWQDQLIAGFSAAVGRERDAAWTEALIEILREACAHKLSGVKASDITRRILGFAIGRLPDADWERHATEALKGPIEIALTILEHDPGRLSPGFTASLLDWLSRVTRGPIAGREALARSGLSRRIAASLDASLDSAAMVASIAARLPDDTEQYLQHQISALSEILDLRAAMRREFDPT